MPANKYALIRYRIIDKCLTNPGKPFPSREDLREACEEALYGSGSGAISLSTIDKDIWAMKNEGELGYYAPIAFSRQEGGYHYTEEDYSIQQLNLGDDELESIRFAAAILDQFRTVPLLNTYEHAIDKIVNRLSIAPHDGDADLQSFIQFEKSTVSIGMERLGPLLSAVREKRVVFLDYQSFRENQIKNYEVHPKLLKEYDNRWYLIGYVPDRRAHLTFGLERMVDVLYSEKTYNSTEPFDALDFFRHSVGITETKSKAEKVTLRLKPIAGRLLHSQPLHPTQTKVKETKDYMEFLLNVYPSPELLAKLFSYGPDLEVISPKKIRDQFREALTRALENYQN